MLQKYPPCIFVAMRAAAAARECRNFPRHQACAGARSSGALKVAPKNLDV